VEHDNSYIPNVKSKSEFGAEVGDDDQRTPFFKCSSEYSNEYLVASATVDPFKSEVEFQATSQYSSFAVGVASQYCLRSGQDDEDNGSCWMPPALKAQWRSQDENLEIGLKYTPTWLGTQPPNRLPELQPDCSVFSSRLFRNTNGI
jgi:hypothetical protein